MRKRIHHVAVALCVGVLYLAGGLELLEDRLTELRFRILRKPAEGGVVVIATESLAGNTTLGAVNLGAPDSVATLNLTLEVIAPRVVQASPADGDNGIALNTAVTVLFSEPMELNGSEEIRPSRLLP